MVTKYTHPAPKEERMNEEHHWLNKDGRDHDEHQQRMAFIIDEGCYRLRPCMLWKPKLSLDGNQWCALYGDNLQSGVAGFGDTPEKAMEDFDKNWKTPVGLKGGKDGH